MDLEDLWLLLRRLLVVSTRESSLTAAIWSQFVFEDGVSGIYFGIELLVTQEFS